MCFCTLVLHAHLPACCSRLPAQTELADGEEADNEGAEEGGVQGRQDTHAVSGFIYKCTYPCAFWALPTVNLHYAFTFTQ